jgi:hypothetical protein
MVLCVSNLERTRCVGGIFHLHFQGRSVNEEKEDGKAELVLIHCLVYIGDGGDMCLRNVGPSPNPEASSSEMFLSNCGATRYRTAKTTI